MMAFEPSARIQIRATDKTKTAFRSVNKSLSRMTSRLKLMGAALAVFAVVGTVRKIAIFEKAISDLSAITGATGKDLQFLSDKARELGKVTTLSASQVADAFKIVASAKPELLKNVEALVLMTEKTIVLAEAAGIDMVEAATTASEALNQYGKSADEAARFINVLAAGSKFGSSTIERTAEALEKAGTVANIAGISFEELNTHIQALAKNAIKGSDAGTALRNIILRLQVQVKDKFNPAIVGLTQSIKNMNAANLGAGELMELVGIRSVAAVQALFLQVDSLDALQVSLTGTNVAYEQAAIRQDNLLGDVKRLQSAFEEFQISLSEGTNPVLRATVQLFTDMFSVFSTGKPTLKSLKEDLVEFGAEAEALRERLKLPVKGIFDLGGLSPRLRELLEKQLADIEFNMSLTADRIFFINKDLTDSLAAAAAKAAEDVKKIADADQTVLDEKAQKELARLRTAASNRLDILRATLFTATEIEEVAFLEKIAVLEESRAMEMISIEDFDNTKEQLEAKHQAKLEKIRITSEKKTSKALIQLKTDVANKAIGLLAMLGTRSKAFAVAAIVLQSVIAAKKIFIESQVAAMAALTPPPIGLGPVAGQALAASILSMGKISAGLTLATGALQLGSLGGGDSASGVFQADPLTGLPVGGGVGDQTSRTFPTDITINIGDAQFISESALRQLIEQINEQIADGVVVGSIQLS